MATVDDVEIVREIIANDGYHPGDPQLYSVWSYTNMEGAPTHSLCMNIAAELSLVTSPCVVDLVLLWNRRGLTWEGAEWLAAH